MEKTTALDREISQSVLRLSTRQKKTVLTVVKAFLEENTDWWDEIGEEQKRAIIKSLAEERSGKLTTHNEVMKKYRGWMKK